MPLELDLSRLRLTPIQAGNQSIHTKPNDLQPQDKSLQRQRHRQRQRRRKPIRQDGSGGLLITDDSQLFSLKFAIAAFAEMLGVMLFSLLGSSCPPDYIPAGNGFTLAVLIYITANVSGGHLNPCVTIATMITGHISILKAVVYVVSQIVGAILGSFLAVGLRPGFSTGGGIGPGCFAPGMSPGSQEMLSTAQAAGWEFFFTFILVSTVFAVAIGKPSFGNVGPGIVGLSLYACAAIGVPLTGASLNIARTLGPFVVFQCFGNTVWAYVLAELAGGIVAGLMSWPLYGTGPEFMRFVEHAARDEAPLPAQSNGTTAAATDIETGLIAPGDLLEEKMDSSCEPDTMVSEKEELEKPVVIPPLRLPIVPHPAAQDLSLRDRFAAPTVVPSSKKTSATPKISKPISEQDTFALAPATLRHVSPEPSILTKQAKSMSKSAPRSKFTLHGGAVGTWNRI